MVANHPGMSDQTSTNVARDGAAKKPQTSFATTHGMKSMTDAMSGVSPGNPGVGPDADPANPLSPSPKLKKFDEVKTAWGMKGTADGDLGKRVLAEAASLGKVDA